MRSRSSWSWLLLAVSGIVLVLFAALHLVAHHFVVEGGLRNYRQVVEYLSSPLIILTESAFLVAVTVHALLGVRSIVFDLGLSDRAERLVSRTLFIVGVFTVSYGLWLTWTIVSQGSTLVSSLAR